jgi:hypothetical protein
VADDRFTRAGYPGFSPMDFGQVYQAMKNDPRRELQDMADVQALLRLPGVDAAEVRGYFERAGMLDKYDAIQRSI